jgi:hypothetical protein
MGDWREQYMRMKRWRDTIARDRIDAERVSDIFSRLRRPPITVDVAVGGFRLGRGDRWPKFLEAAPRGV